MLNLSLLPFTSDPSGILLTYQIFQHVGKVEDYNPQYHMHSFVHHAKHILNAHVDKCNISSHDHIQNLGANNTMLDLVEENNNNQGNEVEQEDDVVGLWSQPK